MTTICRSTGITTTSRSVPARDDDAITAQSFASAYPIVRVWHRVGGRPGTSRSAGSRRSRTEGRLRCRDRGSGAGSANFRSVEMTSLASVVSPFGCGATRSVGIGMAGLRTMGTGGRPDSASSGAVCWDPLPSATAFPPSGSAVALGDTRSFEPGELPAIKLDPAAAAANVVIMVPTSKIRFIIPKLRT